MLALPAVFLTVSGFMKRYLPATLLAMWSWLLPVPLLAQSGHYTIQGQLGPRTPATKIYLDYLRGETVLHDSADIRHGRFQFKGQVAGPTLGILLVKQKTSWPGFLSRSRLWVFLEPGVAQVTSADSLDHAQLRGTPLNNDLQRLNLALQTSENQLKQLRRAYYLATPAQRQNPVWLASQPQRRRQAEDAQKAVYQQFIQHNPRSQVSLAMIDIADEEELNLPFVEPLFRSLAPAVRQSPAGRAYAARLAAARRLAVGGLAPDFSQPDPTGKLVRLSDFRGSYVLIDFWASWCRPCREANPYLVAAYQRYHSRNFTVLGVSLDRPGRRAAWLQAIEMDGLTWPQVSDLQEFQNAAAKCYGVRSIPQNVLVGPDGRILAKNMEAEKLSQRLATVLPARGGSSPGPAAR
jgi:peroxiredoxin